MDTNKHSTAPKRTRSAQAIRKAPRKADRLPRVVAACTVEAEPATARRIAGERPRFARVVPLTVQAFDLAMSVAALAATVTGLIALAAVLRLVVSLAHG